MINKTIGTGGDYADIGLAALSLKGVTPGDNIKFTVLNDLSNVTEGYDFWPGFTPNGYQIEFDLNGKMVTVNQSISFLSARGSAGNGKIIIHNGKLFAGISMANMILRYYTMDQNGADYPLKIFKCYDILFSGHLRSAACQLLILSRNDSGSLYSHLHNLRFCGKTKINEIMNKGYVGFENDNNAGDWPTATQFMENCSIYIDNSAYLNTDKGIRIQNNVNTHEVSLKNIVIKSHTDANIDFGILNTNTTINNCADSDNSLTTGSNNIHGIIDADFITVDPSNADFQKIPIGSKLRNMGRTAISAWNTADFGGRSRPNHRGLVSIGAHEPISADATLRAKINGEYYQVTKQIDL